LFKNSGDNSTQLVLINDKLKEKEKENSELKTSVQTIQNELNANKNQLQQEKEARLQEDDKHKFEHEKLAEQVEKLNEEKNNLEKLNLTLGKEIDEYKRTNKDLVSLLLNFKMTNNYELI
jgi:septal ring factor EnvC (AmiA/AmiB activator)